MQKHQHCQTPGGRQHWRKLHECCHFSTLARGKEPPPGARVLLWNCAACSKVTSAVFSLTPMRSDRLGRADLRGGKKPPPCELGQCPNLPLAPRIGALLIDLGFPQVKQEATHTPWSISPILRSPLSGGDFFLLRSSALLRLCHQHSDSQKVSARSPRPLHTSKHPKQDLAARDPYCFQNNPPRRQWVGEPQWTCGLPLQQGAEVPRRAKTWSGGFPRWRETKPLGPLTKAGARTRISTVRGVSDSKKSLSSTG